MKLPAHRELRLDNGARLAQVDWPGAAFTEVRILLPVFRHSPREAALAHVLGRLLALGPHDPGAGVHAERLLGQGAMATSFGAVDRVGVSVTVPPETSGPVLAEVLGQLTSPDFTPEAVEEAVRGEIARLRRTATHRELRLNELTLEHRWGPGHPYTHAAVTEEDLASLDHDDIVDHARRVLSLEGAALLAVGDLGTRDGARWSGPSDDLARQFADVTPPGAVGTPPDEPGARGGVSAGVATTPDEATASLRITTPAPVRQDPAHPAAHLFSMCLGGYFGSRLVQELRERRGDVYGVTAGFEVLATAASQALVLECPSDRIEPVRSTVASTITDLRTHGPRQRELDEAARFATRAATVGLSHPSALASAGSTVLFGGDGLDLWERQARAISALTPEDIARSGQDHCGPESVVEVFAAPHGGA